MTTSAEMALNTSTHRRRATNPLLSSQFAFPLILSFLLIILHAAKPAQAVLTTCYDPSGDERTDSPCFPDAASSACCAGGWGTMDGSIPMRTSAD
jgi:hypothetical protein